MRSLLRAETIWIMLPLVFVFGTLASNPVTGDTVSWAAPE